MNNYLILKGCAGLGNRLITLSNAIDYAKKTNRVLFIDWSDGQFDASGANAFDTFFLLKDANFATSIKELNIHKNNSYPSLWGEYPEKHLYDLYTSEGTTKLKILTRWASRGRLTQISNGYWLAQTSFVNKIRNKKLRVLLSFLDSNNIPKGGNYAYNINKKYVFFSDYRPLFHHNTLLNHIQLKPGIKNEIEALASRYDINNCIGIHVRMTDKQPNNSIDDVIQRIKKNYHNTPIFLATDNPSVEYKFKSTFSEVVVIEKKLPDFEKSKLGVHFAVNSDKNEVYNMYKNSVIDMWLLSMCKVLFYQENSSFSLISSLLKKDKNNIFTW